MCRPISLFITVLCVFSFGRFASAQITDGGTGTMVSSPAAPSDDASAVDYAAFHACLDACSEPLNQCGVPPTRLRECLDTVEPCRPFQPIIASVIDQLLAQRPRCPVVPAIANQVSPMAQNQAPAVRHRASPTTVRPHRHVPPPWQPQGDADPGQADAGASPAPADINGPTGLANPDLSHDAGVPSHNPGRLTAHDICDIEHGYWQEHYQIPSEDGTHWTDVSLCFTPTDVALFRGLQNLGRRVGRLEQAMGFTGDGGTPANADASSQAPAQNAMAPALQHEREERIADFDAARQALEAHDRRLNNLANGFYANAWASLGFVGLGSHASGPPPLSVGVEFGWRLRLSQRALTYAGIGLGCSCSDAGSGMRAASLYRLGLQYQATQRIALGFGALGMQRFNDRLLSSHTLFGAELEVLFNFLSHGWSPYLGVALVGGVGIRAVESDGQDRTDVRPDGAILIRIGFNYLNN